MITRSAMFLLLACASVSAAQAPPAPVAQTPALPASESPAQAETPALVPQGFTYDSQGRRDPFVSLMRSGGDEQRAASSRPAGLAGLTIAEISLKGTVASRGGFVAILQGADSKAYIVREGEKLLDGTVGTISQNSITLQQSGDDQFSSDKPREVRKVLRQTDEAQ